MSDLINRQNAIDCFWDENRMMRDWLDIIKDIRSLPSAERKRGEWIHHENPKGIFSLECPFCKCWFLHEHLVRNSFCPNCGADMRERREDDK